MAAAALTVMKVLVLCLALASCVGPQATVTPPPIAPPSPPARTHCPDPLDAALGAAAASCAAAGVVLRWDATPLSPTADELEQRPVLVEHPGGERSLHRCHAQWLLAVTADGTCPTDSVPKLCQLDRRSDRVSERELRVTFSDGRTVMLYDEDGDGCPNGARSRQRVGDWEVEELDEDADGHPEIRTSSRQLPCGLPARGQPLSAAGCPEEVQVECDPNSDGVIDASCHSMNGTCSAAACAK